ncbi:MAG: MBL fold metallo-hydrolase [Chloroflexota bacterium]|nr:MBL fold metallo-hydrolase [Chloroflexota bacterium]
MSVTISPIVEGVFAVDSTEGVEVRAVLVYGNDATLLLDTLATPTDLASVREAVSERGKPLLIVNSHADWDHWWGNAAFPEAPVIGHQLTLERQRREGKQTRDEMAEKEERYAGITLRPATIGFDGLLHLDLGGITVELSHLPGHTHDCIVAWVPERELLFAGDTAEDPLPLINEGPIADWPERLREWAERAKIVVPAHGAISGPELLIRNADYLERLFEGEGGQFPELEGADDFYREGHVHNLQKAARESMKG